MEQSLPFFVGVIADTHGLLRPQAVAALQSCGLILHAGDIGRSEILTDLGRIAPVVAVRGNTDRESWAASLPDREMITVADRFFYLLHDFDELDIDPVAAGIDVLVSGHSHRPQMKRKNGILYFNPGSAGPKRWRLPVSVGLLKVTETGIEGEFIEL